MITRRQIVRRSILAGCGAVAAFAAQQSLQADVGAQASSAPAAPLQHVDPAEVDGVIFERQQIMLKLDKDAEELGMIVAGLAPKDKLAATARAVATSARESEESFWLHAAGGRSKPEVWSNWDDYSRRMREFVEKSDAMARKAEAGDMVGVTEALSDALPCKACHDVYRTPKKPA